MILQQIQKEIKQMKAIEKQKVTIEKWLCLDRQEDFVVIETSNIDKYKLHEKVKLLESYVVEL